MSISKKVAKMRFKYHVEAIDICNALNQIGVLKDEKAEHVMKNHCVKAFDCLERLGYDVYKKFEKEEEA